MNEVFTEASSSEELDMFNCAEGALKSLCGIMSLMPLPPVLYKYELMVRQWVGLGPNLAGTNYSISCYGVGLRKTEHFHGTLSLWMPSCAGFVT